MERTVLAARVANFFGPGGGSGDLLLIADHTGRILGRVAKVAGKIL
jgi:hypothetical protein